MKDLIRRIILDSQLKIKDDDDNIFFSYFEDKDDNFIFLFCTYPKLLEVLSLKDETEFDIEYALNAFTYEYKTTRLKNLNDRNIDNNLSFIIVLEEGEKDLTDLYKIEENPIISKKYILSYDNASLTELKQKLEESEDNIVDVFNQLTIENSHLLKDCNNNTNDWYNLLLKIFIKIPFLNYNSNENKLETLDNLEDKILNQLSEDEASIFDVIINEYNDSNKSDIDSFISKYFTNNE